MSSLTPEEIIDKLKNANDRALDPLAVWSQFGLMAAVSVGTVLAFNLLRPKNKIIYEPKVKYHVGNKPPPRISDGLFGWLPPLIHTKEPELVDKVGLDAVAFLRFLRLLRWLFTAVALLCGGMLIPVNVIYNLKNKKENHDLLNMITIRDVDGNALYAHVAATYLITIIICVFVFFHWRAMTKLRNDWFRSPEFVESFYSRTLAIRKVPRKYQTDAGIKGIFDGVKVPYPTTSVNVGRRVGKLPELIDYHNATVRELEQVLVRYLKNGRIGKKRPKVRIGGFLGMGGQTFDAIDYYTAKLKRTEAAIDDYRAQIDTRKPEPYGFASMAAVPYAHIVAKMLQGKHPHGTIIELAPNPKDIIWGNMDMTDLERTRKRLWGFIWLLVVCFLNTVPLLIISFLANLNNLADAVTFLGDWKASSKTTFNVVSGILPPAVSAAFGYFLPIIIRWLSQYMGDLTHSKLDRSVLSHYFAFLVASQLIIFTLVGVFLNLITLIIAGIGKKSFSEVIESFNLNNLPSDIKSTYIDQSSYWLTFFPLRGFLVVFDLAQIVNLVWLSFKTKVFGRTPRDIREWTQPPEFQYSIYYSNTLFMVTVALVFAPLAPAVAIAAAVVMWMSSWVYKYQLMFVYVSRVESGGRMWNMVINRLLFSVVLMQLIMVLTIGLGFGRNFKTFEWISTLPPILIVAIFKMYINRKFLPSFQHYIPSQQELQSAKIHSGQTDNTKNRLEKRFGHPALHSELFTPMLHAKMMPLLGQVYSGKIGSGKAKLEEYNGQKMDTHVVEGGIKIAAIEQSDLERPDLYGRDRGELDWDARSIASTAVFGDAPGMIPRSKSPYYASTASLNPGSTKGFDHDKYLAYGPGHQSNHSHTDIELARFDSMNEPLLSPRGQFYQQQQGSQVSMAPPYSSHAPQRQGTMGTVASESSYYPPRAESPYQAAPYQQPYQQPPSQYNSQPQQYPPRFNSPAPSFHSQSPSQGGHQGGYAGGRGGGAGGGGGNMAGRGAHRT
ncbi:DUF221-domain-containing protein [Flagelloscypha sp. PMI_526]|nr:DUF221-domain-containing protein [Flagelloscypha sp. PMI_526]